jgi:diaminopimelate decarboxylase
MNTTGNPQASQPALPDRRPPRAQILAPAEVERFVAPYFERRDIFLAAVHTHGSPLYVIESAVLRARARRFLAAFKPALPGFMAFFAMKSNSHPALGRMLVEEGLGLDVSSGRELALALELDAPRILFSGPGKQAEELALAMAHAERVTVLMDSIGELERLERAASQAGVRARAGVRLTTDEHGLWRKFGISLADLPAFCEAARACPHVDLRGIHFHTSWNLDPSAQVAFITRLGEALAGLPDEHRRKIEFVDIGGGFWPEQGEWLHRSPDSPGASDPLAQTLAELDATLRGDRSGPLPHYVCPAASIETFAAEIAQAVHWSLAPHVQCAIYAEPGRWLCHAAMHILLTVVDRKGPQLLITDGGTNMIGWERFESDYFPVLDLSRPALKEQAAYVLGSLCTPHDVWGYAYFGESIAPGDVLLIPAQGAYTHSLRQDFIKPLPATVVL